MLIVSYEGQTDNIFGLKLNNNLQNKNNNSGSYKVFFKSNFKNLPGHYNWYLSPLHLVGEWPSRNKVVVVVQDNNKTDDPSMFHVLS